MIFSDETLMAYVDGELDAEARAAVAAAIATDPEVAQRIVRHEALSLSVRAAYERVLSETVPERLVSAARTAPARARNDKVQDLADARATRAQSQAGRPRRFARKWGALAASLVVGLLLGQHFLGAGDAGPFTLRAGQLLARGALAQALSNELAGTAASGSAVQIGVSFRAHSGEYCRTFALGARGARDALAGLACHRQGTWRIDALAPMATGATGAYRMAATELPKSVLAAMDEEIAGNPLDARGEARARQHEWQ